MSKPYFKVIDCRNRIHLPKELRSTLGVTEGDIVSLIEERGRIVAKKAIVLADDKLTPDAKECFVHAAVREFDGPALVELLELIAALIQSAN